MSEASVSVEHATDSTLAQSLAKRFASYWRFSTKQQWEFAIAVGEASSNMIKYARGGHIVMRFRETQSQSAYIEFEARDKGPGIDSIRLAMEDAVSQGVHITDEQAIHVRRGLGYGLGAIRRLVDDFSIENLDKGGVRVIGRKYRRL